MNRARHCALCEHEKTDLTIGVTCGLTDKKPDFQKTCPDILLDEKFQTKLEDINLDIHEILTTKNKVYTTFYIMIVLGFACIIGNKLFGDLMKWSLYYRAYRAFAIGIGITTLISAYFNLNSYRSKLSALNEQKHRIDSVLDKYGISYSTSVDLKEKIHGKEEIEISIEYSNWTKKRTTTMYNRNYGGFD